MPRLALCFRAEFKPNECIQAKRLSLLQQMSTKPIIHIRHQQSSRNRGSDVSITSQLVHRGVNKYHTTTLASAESRSEDDCHIETSKISKAQIVPSTSTRTQESSCEHNQTASNTKTTNARAA